MTDINGLERLLGRFRLLLDEEGDLGLVHKVCDQRVCYVDHADELSDLVELAIDHECEVTS